MLTKLDNLWCTILGIFGCIILLIAHCIFWLSMIYIWCLYFVKFHSLMVWHKLRYYVTKKKIYLNYYNNINKRYKDLINDDMNLDYDCMEYE